MAPHRVLAHFFDGLLPQGRLLKEPFPCLRRRESLQGKRGGFTRIQQPARKEFRPEGQRCSGPGPAASAATPALVSQSHPRRCWHDPSCPPRLPLVAISLAMQEAKKRAGCFRMPPQRACPTPVGAPQCPRSSVKMLASTLAGLVRWEGKGLAAQPLHGDGALWVWDEVGTAGRAIRRHSWLGNWSPRALRCLRHGVILWSYVCVC